MLIGSMLNAQSSACSKHVPQRLTYLEHAGIGRVGLLIFVMAVLELQGSARDLPTLEVAINV